MLNVPTLSVGMLTFCEAKSSALNTQLMNAKNNYLKNITIQMIKIIKDKFHAKSAKDKNAKNAKLKISFAAIAKCFVNFA
jgi:hypothetical protein